MQIQVKLHAGGFHSLGKRNRVRQVVHHARSAIRIHERPKADTVCSPRPEEGDDISGLARIFENGAPAASSLGNKERSAPNSRNSVLDSPTETDAQSHVLNNPNAKRFLIRIVS